MADEFSFSAERPDRAGSISSNQSQRGVDLLDAADGIRTIDFRSRLQASGAKDFGEDVADRNIREHSAGDPQTMSNPARGRRIIVARDSFNSRSGLSGGPGAVTLGSRTVSSSSITASPENSDPAYLTTQYLKSDLRASFFPDETIEPGSFSRRNKNRLSLNTYTPSGLEPPPLTPRSYVTTPGMNDAAKAGGPSSPGAGPEGLAGKYFISPTDSSFSQPSSPHSVSSPTRNYAGPDEADEESNWERVQQLGDVSASRTLAHLRKPIGNVGHTKRFSVQTLRSSLSSTITSRYPSGADFIPLGYPRMRSNSLAEINRPVEGDEGPSRRNASFRKLDPTDIHIVPASVLTQAESHKHSLSSSSEDSYVNTRLKNHSSALRDLVEIDEHNNNKPHRARSTRQWVFPATPSSSGASNMYSASSGARPTSRHTNATSVDSQQHATTTSSPLWTESDSSDARRQQMMVFNIDDYVSSDDDEFFTPDDDDEFAAARARPTAEGEEDLLFDGNSFGLTGAVLPGLAEHPPDDDDAACPPPPAFDGGGGGGAEIADIEDDRASVDRDPPLTLIRHMRSHHHHPAGPFGGVRQRPVVPRRVGTAGVPAPVVSSSADCILQRTLSEIATMASADEGLASCRLSALGTLHGGSVDSAVSLDDEDAAIREVGEEEGGLEVGEVVRLNYATAVRLRKVSKARKRAEESRAARDRRMTSAFGGRGDGEDEEDDDDEGRGRSLVRKGDKGKGKETEGVADV